MSLEFLKTLSWEASESPNRENLTEDDFDETDIENVRDSFQPNDTVDVFGIIHKIILAILNCFFEGMVDKYELEFLENISVYWQESNFISVGFVVKTTITKSDFETLTNSRINDLNAFKIKLKAQTNQRMATLNFVNPIHLMTVLVGINKEFRKPSVFGKVLRLLSGVVPIKTSTIGSLRYKKFGAFNLMKWEEVKWFDDHDNEYAFGGLVVFEVIEWIKLHKLHEKERLSYKERIEIAFNDQFRCRATPEAVLRFIDYKGFKLSTKHRVENGIRVYCSDDLLKQQEMTDTLERIRTGKNKIISHTKGVKEPQPTKIRSASKNAWALVTPPTPPAEPTKCWDDAPNDAGELKGEFEYFQEFNNTTVCEESASEDGDEAATSKQTTVLISQDDTPPQLITGEWKDENMPDDMIIPEEMPPTESTLSTNAQVFVPTVDSVTNVTSDFVMYNPGFPQEYQQPMMQTECIFRHMTVEQYLKARELEAKIAEFNYKALLLKTKI